MHIDVSKGDQIQHARVVRRYYSGLGVETAVLELGQHTDEDHLIKEMTQMGWTHDFTRDSTGQAFFRDAGTVEATQLTSGTVVVHETDNGDAWISGFVEVKA